MGPPSDQPGGDSSTRDLGAFNRWLCISRLRAAVAVAVFGVVIRAIGVTELSVPPLLAICALLCVVSAIGLFWRAPARAPVLFFSAQQVTDLAAVTVGIGACIVGPSAIIFRFLYILIIVPSALVSVQAGLTVTTLAALGHVGLIAGERGLSLATLLSVQSLVPTFLFYLVAQQAFFYGAHLQRKNEALAALAARLRHSREKLAAEIRLSSELVEAARTLSTTLDAPALLDHVTQTTREQMCADWGGTFLVDQARGVFRLAAVTDGEVGATELGRIDFPLSSWSAIDRVCNENVVVLTGAEAERTPALFTGGRHMSTVLVAALHRSDTLVGFLAVGYASTLVAARDWATHLLAGVAEHATIVLQNARLLDEVRQASALKSEFVGAISHELRSPLNVILGYLEMALDGGLGPIAAELDEALRRCQRQSIELLELITALLDLNRLEAGRLPVHGAAVAVGELLENIREQLPENWVRDGVKLRFEIAPDLPGIETDAHKLKMVVRNLVHNALKFTERGSVTLAAGVGADGDIDITVTDTGRGIPADALPYVFDMFRQVPGTGGGGVGLGLHIVQRFVDVLGGTVSVTSELGVGSCFTVTLPRTSGRLRLATAERPASADANAA